MRIFAILQNLDKKFSWSFLGFLLAIIFGLLTIYVEFIKDSTPNLRFEILSNTSVLDVKEEITNLEIIYDGIDIKKSNQSIRLIVFRVINIGPDDILKGYYDENDLLGFLIRDGKIIKTEIVNASNDYLTRTVYINIAPGDTATFTPVILETGENFVVKTLVLHDINVNPTIIPIGKVAKVKSLSIVQEFSQKIRPSFFFRTFSGSFWTQVVRTVSYFIGFILLMFLIFTPPIFFSGRINKFRRRKHIKWYKLATSFDLNKAHEKLFEIYIENDLQYLKIIEDIISNQRSFKEYLSDLNYEKNKIKKHRATHPGFVITSSGAPPIELHRLFGIESDMKDSGILQKENIEYVINKEMKKFLKDFIKYLSNISK